jgi:hypothetical protein
LQLFDKIVQHAGHDEDCEAGKATGRQFRPVHLGVQINGGDKLMYWERDLEMTESKIVGSGQEGMENGDSAG